MIVQWTTDLRHAWRALRRTPGFLVTCIGTLALAIGAVAGMFTVVDAVLLRPLPYREPGRLVVLGGTAPGSDLPERFNLAGEFYLHYRDNARLLDGVFAFDGGTSTLRTADRVERVPMAWPTPEMWTTLGVQPQLGRLPRAEEGDDVVLISDELWSSWFGRDPSVIGKSYFVSDAMKRIIGVMPSGFRFPDERTLLWVSSPIDAGDVTPGQFGTAVVARLKPGVTREQAATELTTLARQLPARFGGSPGYARIIERHRAVVDDLRERLVGDTARTSLWVLLGAVSVVLLIACANVTNLFLVRAEGRRREMAVRRAIGAARMQLARLQMAEALLVALPAGAAAVLLCAATLPVFVRAAPEGIAGMGAVSAGASTVLAAFALSLVVALACGVVPALRASAPDLARLRDGGRGTTRARRWGRDLLVVGQTALALVLLTCSALLVRSFQKLRHVDPGYEVKDIYTFQFAPDQPGLRDGPSYGRMHLAMMERLRALPGVTAVGVVNNIPLDEGTGSWRFATERMGPDDAGALVGLNVTGGDYFRVMGIRLLQGRTFTDGEATTPNTSIILSRSAAEKLWPGEGALGRQLRRVGGAASPAPVFTVVGVVDDVKQDDWREDGQAVAYLPLTGPTPTSWSMGSPAYAVKSSRAASLGPQVRALVREVAPEAPVYREYTMEFLAERSMVQLSFTMLTLGVVSALALVLGALGLYGVLSYVVAGRTREIGVRMALGATAAAVLRRVVADGALIVLAGIVVGTAGALASTRLLATLLYDVPAADPLTFGATALAMLAVGMLASWMPARRASGVAPTESLRHE